MIITDLGPGCRIRRLGFVERGWLPPDCRIRRLGFVNPSRAGDGSRRTAGFGGSDLAIRAERGWLPPDCRVRRLGFVNPSRAGDGSRRTAGFGGSDLSIRAERGMAPAGLPDSAARICQSEPSGDGFPLSPDCQNRRLDL
ncbi:hypothetical protein QUF72_06235 [Desulfobacterales bacterium HSG2]|nr:hypothetical protein [Desulfobacterales bacterium HSG2]